MNALEAILAFFVYCVVLVAFGAFSGLFVAIFWNYLFVGAGSIIGVSLPALTWFKGWLLSLMCSLLFKSIPNNS